MVKPYALAIVSIVYIISLFLPWTTNKFGDTGYAWGVCYSCENVSNHQPQVYEGNVILTVGPFLMNWTIYGAFALAYRYLSKNWKGTAYFFLALDLAMYLLILSAIAISSVLPDNYSAAKIGSEELFGWYLWLFSFFAFCPVNIITAVKVNLDIAIKENR